MNVQNCSAHRELRQVAPAGASPTRSAHLLLWMGCVALLLSAPLATQAQEMFMRIGGQAQPMGQTQTAPTLAGESLDSQYTNWIPVLSMSHGVSRPITFTGGTVTPNHTDVSFVKQLDKTTPSINLLVNGSVSGTGVTMPIDFVTIDFRTIGTTNVYYRMEMQGVYLTSAQIGAAGGTGMPAESVSLTYSRIRWSYVQYLGGKAQTPITKGWDLSKNGPY